MSGTLPAHVIFDLDGTLVDSAPGILSGLDAALRTHGVAPAVPLTSAIVGPPLAETLVLLCGTMNAERLAQVARTFKEYYDSEAFRQLHVFPGVDAMLRRLADEHVTLHIATNKRLRPTLAILDHLGWRGVFASVFASDMRSPPFPDKAEMLGSQLAEQAIAANACAYVGDRAEDGRAADANGVAFYLATWGYAGTIDADLPPRWRRVPSPESISWRHNLPYNATSIADSPRRPS